MLPSVQIGSQILVITGWYAEPLIGLDLIGLDLIVSVLIGLDLIGLVLIG